MADFEICSNGDVYEVHIDPEDDGFKITLNRRRTGEAAVVYVDVQDDKLTIASYEGEYMEAQID